MIMKRIRYFIAMICAAAMVTMISAVPSAAQSASVGDTVVVRTYVSNQDNMATISAVLSYDENYLDFLSADVIYGTSSCNTEIKGEVRWATVLSFLGGEDFTEKTEVATVTMIAKSNITNVEELISNTVLEAYDGDLVQVDYSSVTAEAEVYSDDSSANQDTSSKTEFVISRYEDVSREDSESVTFSSAKSEAESESSEVSSKDSDTSDSDTDSTSALESEQIEDMSSTAGQSKIFADSSAVQTEEMPASPDSPDRTVSGSIYLISIIAGAVVLIIIAAVLIFIKGRAVNKNASHMR